VARVCRAQREKGWHDWSSHSKGRAVDSDFSDPGIWSWTHWRVDSRRDGLPQSRRKCVSCDIDEAVVIRGQHASREDTMTNDPPDVGQGAGGGSGCEVRRNTRPRRAGQTRPARMAESTMLQAPRTGTHSSKPDAFYELSSALSGSKVEFFARRLRTGWTTWGSELWEDQTREAIPAVRRPGTRPVEPLDLCGENTTDPTSSQSEEPAAAHVIRRAVWRLFGLLNQAGCDPESRKPECRRDDRLIGIARGAPGSGQD